MSIELCSVWFEMNVMLWQRKLMQLSRRILHASGTLPPPASLSALKDECPQHFIGWDKCFFLARKVWSLLSLPSSLSLWDQSFTLGSLQWAQAFFPSYGHPSRNSTTPGDKSMTCSSVCGKNVCPQSKAVVYSMHVHAVNGEGHVAKKVVLAVTHQSSGIVWESHRRCLGPNIFTLSTETVGKV